MVADFQKKKKNVKEIVSDNSINPMYRYVDMK